MNDQYNDRDHAWELTFADHSHAHRIIKYEECMKCGAARVTEFPSGDLFGIEPEGTSLYYCSDNGQFNCDTTS